MHEADDFWMVNGKYTFNPRWLPEAHRACFDAAEESCMMCLPEINIANTNTRLSEFADYIELARSHGYEVEVYHVKGNWGSIHDIPKVTLRKMAERWEPYEGEIIINNE